MIPRAILVYHPDAAEARGYAELVRLPRPSLSVRVASTPEEAADLVAETEILYAWGFPTPLLRLAPKLGWVQSMGAGVERFIVPELSRRARGVPTWAALRSISG